MILAIESHVTTGAPAIDDRENQIVFVKTEAQVMDVSGKHWKDKMKMFQTYNECGFEVNEKEGKKLKKTASISDVLKWAHLFMLYRL